MGLPASLEEYQGIIEEVALGSVVESIEPLNGGISAEISLLTLRRQDRTHKKLVARCPGDWGDEDYAGKAVREARKYQFASDKGLLAPVPFACFPERNFFLLEYSEGTPILAPSQGAAFVDSVATHLAKIHSTSLSSADLEWLPGPDSVPSVEGWNPVVVDALTKHGHPTDQPKQLCHGDLWPGNVLWQGDALVGIIDWESMQVGYPLSDLAIARLDLVFAFGWEVAEAFTRRYFRSNWCQLRMACILGSSLLPKGGSGLRRVGQEFHPVQAIDVTADHLRQRQAEFIERALEHI